VPVPWFNKISATRNPERSSLFSNVNCILSKSFDPIMETTPIPNELQIEFFYLKKAALIFRAINNKIRLQILQLLNEHHKLTVTALYIKLRLDQSATSQHLAILRKAGLVNTERDGKNIYYSINHTRLQELHELAIKLF
jgi:DNA-binding transcriptional ArsR family regulator